MKKTNMPEQGQGIAHAKNQSRENADMNQKTELMPESVNLMGGNREFIDSQELLVMVNEARKECGQKPIRNNDFVARIAYSDDSGQ